MNDNAKMIIDRVTSQIDTILEVIDISFDDINYLFSKKSDIEKNQLLSEIINHLLQKLKDNILIENYIELLPNVENILSYFNTSQNTELLLEADNLANELYYKVVIDNERRLNLPIDLDAIKTYMIPAEIKNSDIFSILLWVFIKYEVVLKCIKKDKNKG